MKLTSIACACLLLTFIGCKKSDPTAPAAPSLTQAAPTASLSSLTGKWQRSDGDYSIVIKTISPDGKADATYFNPGPIHVSWAQATESALVLELELRDQNYPGCLYRLTSSAPNLLVGTYYQAMTKETYNVSFTRLP